MVASEVYRLLGRSVRYTAEVTPPSGLSLTAPLAYRVAMTEYRVSQSTQSRHAYPYFSVSGANFSLVCGAVVLAVRLAGASTRVTVAVGLATMFGFVILVRPTDSVLRAAVMGGVGLLGALAARRAQALPALGAAVVVVLLFWPHMAVGPGFALSVVATLGLVLWAAPLRRWWMVRRVPEPVAVLLAMTMAAQILTTPLVIAISDRVSLVSLPANLLVAPVVGVIALLGTAAALAGSVGATSGAGALVAEWLIRATGPEMWWLIGCAQGLGGHAWSAPQVPGWQAAIVVTLIGIFVALVWRARERAGERLGGAAVGGAWHDGRRERSAVSAVGRRRLLDRSGHQTGRGAAVPGHRRRRPGDARAGRRGDRTGTGRAAEPVAVRRGPHRGGGVGGRGG
ncbi:hypothetical protein GCM10023217_15220 [Gordonia alkaliphila]|uniref:ComEC/Rec2-related protein domain-containing protein n=1 Tax=Gordonia alkaliphila TaxID=1053547 RepID=A0ABP8Z4V0_9ACTN